jgi:MoaA/NifB/PqqE/SkfB family radical SAM enzyme
MGYLNYLKYGKRILCKRRTSPIYFVFFVTGNCNARCKHCLLGERERVTNELTIDEIEKVSASMDNMLFFTPTGGEPFLRKDLAEIVKIFHRNNKALNVGIPTNGSLTGRVVSTVQDVLVSCPDIDLHIDVSIDALGEEHDQIRGFDGLFERAIQTYKELRQMEKHYKNLSTCVEITVSAFNQDKLPELYNYLTNKVGVNTVFTLLTRGAPRNAAAKNFDISKYEEFHRLLEQDNKARLLSGYYKMPFSDILNAKRIVRPKLIAKTVRQNKYQIPCYAGSLGGAMFSQGQVLPCELLVDKVMGNVRDYDYDFKKIWFSEKADEIRKWIRQNKCFCTYECFLTINILFNPLMLPQVFKEWGALKLCKLKYMITSLGRSKKDVQKL